MKSKKMAVFLSIVLLLSFMAVPAWADAVTKKFYRAIPDVLSDEKNGFKMEVPSTAFAINTFVTVEAPLPSTLNPTDSFYVIRPLNVNVRDDLLKPKTVSDSPIRFSYAFDINDYKRASNLNTNLSVGRFRIGYWKNDINDWDPLPSTVFWNGENGVVETESDICSGQFALLWPYSSGVDMSPIEEDIRIMINYKLLRSSETPYIKDGRTMVPLRVIAESLGAKVDWNASEQRIDLIRGVDKVQLWIGKNQASKNNQSFAIDVPPEITGNRTFVPLRLVSESFGASVDWDNITRTAQIKP